MSNSREGTILNYTELARIRVVNKLACAACGVDLKVGDEYHIQRLHYSAKYWHQVCWDKQLN